MDSWQSNRHSFLEGFQLGSSRNAWNYHRYSNFTRRPFSIHEQLGSRYLSTLRHATVLILLHFDCSISGDIRQYDITDPANPKLVGQLYISGSAVKGGNVTILEENITPVNSHDNNFIQLFLKRKFFVSNSWISSCSPAGTNDGQRPANLWCTTNDPINIRW